MGPLCAMPSLMLALVLLTAVVPGVPAARRLRPAATRAPPAPSRPSYIECQDSSECQEGQCCALGADRYSIPSCRPLQALGAACRPSGATPLNTTVYYPDESLVQLNVFWLFCPCGEGLFCQRESHSCQAQTEADAAADASNALQP